MPLVCLPASAAPLLSLQTTLEFAAVRSHRFKGQVLVHFDIVNNSAYAANSPFLAFPQFGWRFTSAPGWLLDTFWAGRAQQMARFRPAGRASIGTGQKARACTLHMNFTAHEGGALCFMSGVQYALCELPELKLFHVLGAGNFAPQRASIIVDANRLRSAVCEAIPSYRPRNMIAAEHVWLG